MNAVYERSGKWWDHPIVQSGLALIGTIAVIVFWFWPD